MDDPKIGNVLQVPNLHIFKLSFSCLKIINKCRRGRREGMAFSFVLYAIVENIIPFSVSTNHADWLRAALYCWVFNECV